jgi:hypothetical protein
VTCPNRHQALKVLTGELSASRSNELLEHFRRCGECREAFDFAARTMSRTRNAVAAPARPGAGPASSGSSPYSGSWPNPVRRNRRTLVVFGVAAFALALAGVGRGRGDAPPAEASPEAVCNRLLGEGTPLVQSPAGAFDARPRVISALVPPGSGSIRIAVLDDGGHVVFERDAKPGSAGCFVEEAAIDAPGGAFTAGRLMAPFPDEAELVVDAGRPYGIVVTVAGGHASPASVFQIGRPVALQGAPVEGR